jgi:hydrogenase nickel incorporation protein HypB
LLVLSKVDLLPYVPFEIDKAVENARRVHPGIDIVKVSCLTRSGLHEWLLWLEKRKHDYLASAPLAVSQAAT